MIFSRARHCCKYKSEAHFPTFSESRLDVWRSRMPRMCYKDILFLFKTRYGEVPGDYLREASLKDTRECDRFARYFRRH